jgi:hypothetical protein
MAPPPELGVTNLSGLRPETRRKLECLWVDWYTAQVVTAFREHELEPLLLKGPAITRWLYAKDPGARGYIDADLLVPPHGLALAERTLSELDFHVEDLPWLDDERPHAKSWRRGDGAVVDLHRVPLGAEHLDPVIVWNVWRTEAQVLEVGALGLLVPSVPVRLLSLLLAIRPELDDEAHEVADLERALATVDLSTWHQSAVLARRLGLGCDCGYALSRRPAGAELAVRLELPTSPPLRVLLEADPLLRAAVHLRRIRGPRAKLRYLRRRLLPPPVYVRELHPHAPGVAVAYAAWLTGGLVGVPRAIAACFKALRARRD